jgi:ribosomal protein L11 methyltransferase
MKSPLWKFSVTTSSEAEDAVAVCIEKFFGRPAVGYTHLPTRRATVSAYFDSKPPWSQEVRARLQAELVRLKKSGLRAGSCRVSLQRLQRQDWAEAWKRHFPPFEVQDKLLVKPSWSRRQPRRGQGLIVLDPGLSFGTGQHATTRFCLEQLVVRRRPGAAQSFLDMGTGSGILAIAAARLGYSPVVAFDCDTEVVRVARTNARRNRIGRRIRFAQKDVTCLPQRPRQKFDVVCANLIADLLVRERERIAAHVMPSGIVVLAGILKAEFRLVQKAYEGRGLKLVASRSEKEWRSGSFVAPLSFRA